MSDDLPWLSPAARFPDTRASVLERLRTGSPQARTAAFGDLVTGYWKPVYKYLRLKWRQGEDDAADNTQAFLALAFEKEFFEKFDPGQARFRTFLRICLDRFVMKEIKRAEAQRRGGGAGHVPLDFPGAEGELARAGQLVPAEADQLFHHEFVRELFGRAVADLRAECDRDGRAVPFMVFERYDLEMPDGLTYGDLARDLGLPVTQVTNYLSAMRRRFRELALLHLRALCGTDDEFRAEARDLFGVDVA